MSTFFNNYKNILRISPNVGGDDATQMLNSDINGLQLSDSQGIMLPIHFRNSQSPDATNFIIIQTKTDCDTTVSENFITRNSLMIDELSIGDISYPLIEPKENQVLGFVKSEDSITWMDITEKFQEALKEIADTTSVTNGIPEGLILYNAMPYKRYKFHKLRQEITDEEVISGKITKVDGDSKLYKAHHLICKDYHLCDGNNGTPNLMRDEPTFIRGLNYTISDNQISEEEPDFIIGYCAEDLRDIKDVHDNPCEYYPKKITECKFYEHTVSYLSSRAIKHRHLLFSDKSAETEYFNTKDNQNICIYKTGFDSDNGLTIPSGYEPIFNDTYNESWYAYCNGTTNFFNGVQPIPTAALVKTYTDQETKIKENEIESSYSIARTGFMPFSYEHHFKQTGETKVKNFTGKYILYGITSKKDNGTLNFNKKYIWRTMTSLPFLHPEKLGEGVTNIMKQEINHNAPHPSYINLLPLLKK